MKTIYTLIILLILSTFCFAQAPQAINYQGVARDSQGHPLINQNINIKLSILDSSATGQAVYVETHSVTTNSNGLFNLGIGNGLIVTGAFSNIPWGYGDKWLQVEMDTGGASNYILIGTTQFLSVPYALHAQTANSISTGSISGSTFNMISLISSNNYTFWDAMNYCYLLTEGGYTDWRLPTLEEIQNFVQINGIPKLNTWTKTYNFQSIPTNATSDYATYFYVTLDPSQPGNNATSIKKFYINPAPIQCVR